MNKRENIVNAIDGDKKAIRSVVKDCSEEIYKLIYLHTKYEEDSIAILKKIFTYTKENIVKLKDESEFKIWLYNISIISINSFLKKHGMVDNLKKQKYYYENNKISLYKGIDLLEMKYKNVIILKYYFDFSIEEIGKILNLNEDTVNIYIRQALKEMKSSIGENL